MAVRRKFQNRRLLGRHSCTSAISVVKDNNRLKVNRPVRARLRLRSTDVASVNESPAAAFPALQLFAATALVGDGGA
jgi:hypothetical protein